MRLNLIIFLLLSLTALSQNNLINEINNYTIDIDSNSDLNTKEYDWDCVFTIQL